MRAHHQQRRTAVHRAKAHDQVLIAAAIHLKALALGLQARLSQLGSDVLRRFLQGLGLVKAAAQKILAQRPHMTLQALGRYLQACRHIQRHFLRCHWLGQHAATDTGHSSQRTRQKSRPHPFAVCARGAAGRGCRTGLNHLRHESSVSRFKNPLHKRSSAQLCTN